MADYTLNASKNWKNIRLGCKIVYSEGSLQLSIPARMSIKTQNSYDIIDGIEAYNQGVVGKAPRYTFAVSVPSNTDSSRLLQHLSDNQEPFDFYIVEIEPNVREGQITAAKTQKTDFRFLGECLKDCYLNGYELSVESQTLPIIAFDGIALRHDKQVWNVNTDIIDWISATSDGIMWGTGKLTDIVALKAISILDNWGYTPSTP
jgi:hypothetical protein